MRIEVYFICLIFFLAENFSVNQNHPDTDIDTDHFRKHNRKMQFIYIESVVRKYSFKLVFPFLVSGPTRHI